MTELLPDYARIEGVLFPSQRAVVSDRVQDEDLSELPRIFYGLGDPTNPEYGEKQLRLYSVSYTHLTLPTKA